MKGAEEKPRCAWVTGDPLYLNYHDEEWGVPVHDDRRLFEFLILEGMQAGLSWLTVLKKRDHFRRAFSDYSPEEIAMYGEDRIRCLLSDPGIIRNRRKIEAAIANARAFLTVQNEFTSFDAFIWRFAPPRASRIAWKTPMEIPAQTPESRTMSRALTNRGFRFVGPTICYALMQAVGMVNDHTVDCFRYREIEELKLHVSTPGENGR